MIALVTNHIPSRSDHSAEARACLEVITENFLVSGSVMDKNHDDLRFELEFVNDWAFAEDMERVEVTLLELLQASTTRMAGGNQEADHIHIHQLIELSFIEVQALQIISDLVMETGSTDLTAAHYPLLDRAVRPYVSEYGIAVLNRLSKRVNGMSTHYSPLRMQLVFECDGSDILTLPHSAERSERHLLDIARSLAVEHEVPLSDITLRFAEDATLRRVDHCIATQEAVIPVT